MQNNSIRKIVLAYSGGLDTSVILRWLIQNYSAEVIAYVANVGQEEELEGLEEKAKKTGASKVYIEDLRQEFVKEYIFPAIRAHAQYEGLYLLGTSLARPLIAKRQVAIAEKEKADALAHGATGKGNDQVRFELAFQSLAPELSIIAPWRQWNLHSRAELIDFARQHGIDIPVSHQKPFSSDRNLMHISFEGGILEDPNQEPDENIFVLTQSPLKAPENPEYLTIRFQKGDPVALNGQNLDPLPLFESLNRIAGEHGVGRVDIVENRLVGMKSRGVYESPGATLLMTAHQALETLTLERDTFHYKEMISLKYAELVYNGFWFHPLRNALDHFIDSTQEYVNGEVELKLYKGTASVTRRTSNDSLYDPQLSTFEADTVYQQKDAEGFIRLLGLSSKESAKRDKKRRKNP